MIDPQACFEFIRRQAPEYAQAKANRVYLEEYSKTLKARLMKACGETAVSAQEREAYAHPDYLTHLEGIRAAVEAEETLRWKMVAAQQGIEIFRSLEASARAEGRAAR